MTTLIETMRVRAGTIPFVWFHRTRLAASCAALGVPEPSFWGDALAEAEQMGDGVLRVAWNGVAEWSTRSLADGPVALRTSPVIHEPYPHKTTERGVFERAGRGTDPDEPLLLTGDRLVAETARFAVLWFEGERLCAVDPSLQVLPSVGVHRVGRLADIAYRRISRDRLTDSPLAVVNAVRGVVPVGSLDGVSRDLDTRWATLQKAFWPA